MLSASQAMNGGTYDEDDADAVPIDLEIAVDGLRVTSSSALVAVAASPYRITNAVDSSTVSHTLPRRVILRSVKSTELCDTAGLDTVLRGVVVELGDDPRRGFERLYNDVYVVNDVLLRRLVGCIVGTSSAGTGSTSSTIPMPQVGHPLRITLRMHGSSSGSGTVIGLGSSKPSFFPITRAAAPPPPPPPPRPLPAAVKPHVSPLVVSYTPSSTPPQSVSASSSSAASSQRQPVLPKRTPFRPPPASNSSSSNGSARRAPERASDEPEPSVLRPILQNNHPMGRSPKPVPLDNRCVFCGYDLSDPASVSQLQRRLRSMRHNTADGAPTTTAEWTVADICSTMSDPRPTVPPRAEPRVLCRRRFLSPLADRAYVAHPRCAHITSTYQMTGEIDDVCGVSRSRCANCQQFDAIVRCYEPTCTRIYCIVCSLFAENLVDFGAHDPTNPIPACPSHAYKPAPGSTASKRTRVESACDRSVLFDSAHTDACVRDPDDDDDADDL